MKYTQNNLKTKQKIGRYLAVGTLLLVVIAAGLLLAFRDSGTQPASKTVSESAKDENSIDFSPATKEDQQTSDALKEEATGPAPAQNTNSEAQVFISYAAQNDDTIEVNAYSSRYEDGDCTFTFTKPGQSSIIKKTSATRDASTTICSNPMVNRAEFPVSGPWVVQVRYTAGAKTGISSTKAIDIR